jgi:hypothetical protein
VEQVATSGRVWDVLVGLAGTGKTVALSGLLVAWEEEHGLGSMKGLAPSASAAANLSEELGIPTENTAKWLSEVDREPERWPRSAGCEPLPRSSRRQQHRRRSSSASPSWGPRPGVGNWPLVTSCSLTS